MVENVYCLIKTDTCFKILSVACYDIVVRKRMIVDGATITVQIKDTENA